MNSTKLRSPYLLLALASLPSLLHADEKVGLQFLSSREAAGLLPAESAGTALTTQVNWNSTDNSAAGGNLNIVAPLAGSLVNDTGADSGITVSWSAAGTWNTNNGISTPQSKLLNGYIDNTGSGATVDFSNIPYAKYSVVVYFGSDGNGRTGQINSSTAGVAYSYSTSSAFGRAVTPADYKLTNNTTGGNPTANYCIFTNQSSPTFSLNIIRGSNNSGFHAVQIVEGGDTDGDTMPDSYESANGLNPLVDDRTGDLDSDGATNFAEFTGGTKPNVADTDGDGLLDGAENLTGIYVSTTNAGTNPLVTDTDKDGINDGAEPATGPGDAFVTNPVKRDTDGDGYTDGYEVTKGTNPTDAASNSSIVVAGGISINFTGGYNGGMNAVTGTAGAGSFATANWNNKDGPIGSLSALTDNAAAATDAILTWTSNNVWAVVDPTLNVPADEDGALMNGYLDTNDTSTTSVIVENIPYRRYDVVLYVDGDSGDGTRSGTYTVNGVTRTGIKDGSNWPVAAGSDVYTEAVGSASTGNYIIFRNVGGGTLNITATPTAVRAPINGIQIFGTLDGDGDGMPDQYETDNGFNPASGADGALDADSDGLSNVDEYRKGTLPRVADSDNDGLLDGVETGTGTYVGAGNTGTAPLTPDTDGDGLKDGEEVATYQTNPLLRDTDGDGYADGYEVRFGTLANNSASPALNAARSIGVHFNSITERDFAPTEEAGFILSRQTFWNNADTANAGSTANILTPTASSLVDNAGAVTPVTITWSADTVYATTNGSANGDSKLIGGYIDNTGTLGATISLTDIPFERYDVIVYFGSDGNGRTGSVYSPTASKEFFYTTAANIGAAGFAKDGYTETTSIVSGTNTASNFCRFKGQTTSTFDLQINRGSANSGIHGIQIVESILPRIQVSSVTRNNAGAVTVVWESTPGSTYLVERSTDLDNWSTLEEALPAAGTSTPYTDNTLPANTPKAFYRITRN